MTPMDHAYAEEHGLVDAYLADRLSDSERNAFEAHFFACKTCLAQLEMASDFRAGMRDVAAEETAKTRLGVLARLAAVPWTRQIPWTITLLLLALLLISLFQARNRNFESQLAEAPRTPAPPPSASDPRLEAERRALHGSMEDDIKRLEEELAQTRQTQSEEKTAENRPQVNVPIFLLAAVRSGEEAGREPVNRLQLPAADGSIVLAMELATIDYSAYQAFLRDEAGKEIWKSRGLQPDSRDTLSLLLPSTMLDPGVYELTIEGEKGVVVGAYPFRVVRQP